MSAGSALDATSSFFAATLFEIELFHQLFNTCLVRGDEGDVLGGHAGRYASHRMPSTAAFAATMQLVSFVVVLLFFKFFGSRYLKGTYLI